MSVIRVQVKKTHHLMAALVSDRPDGLVGVVAVIKVTANVLNIFTVISPICTCFKK